MSTATLNGVNRDAVQAFVQQIQRNPEQAHTKWSAAVRWKRGLQSEAVIGQFDPLICDAPQSLGGDGTAPHPMEQLIASLGSCLAAGYAAHATARNIQIDELAVALEGTLNLKTVLGLAQGNAGYESIRADVTIKSDAADEQIQALHETVVASSPVGHSVSRAVPLTIQLGVK